MKFSPNLYTYYNEEYDNVQHGFQNQSIFRILVCHGNTSQTLKRNKVFDCRSFLNFLIALETKFENFENFG